MLRRVERWQEEPSTEDGEYLGVAQGIDGSTLKLAIVPPVVSLTFRRSNDRSQLLISQFIPRMQQLNGCASDTRDSHSNWQMHHLKAEWQWNNFHQREM